MLLYRTDIYLLLIFATIFCNKSSTTWHQLGWKQKELVYYTNDPSWGSSSSRLASQFCEKRSLWRVACASISPKAALASVTGTHIYITQCLLAVTESTAGKMLTSEVIHIFTSFEAILPSKKPFCISVGNTYCIWRGLPKASLSLLWKWC